MSYSEKLLIAALFLSMIIYPALASTPDPGEGSVIWSHDFSDGMPSEFDHTASYPDSGTWGRAHDLDGGGVYEPASINNARLEMEGPSCSYRGAAYPRNVDRNLTDWEFRYKVDPVPGNTGHGDRRIGGIRAKDKPHGSYNDDYSEIGREVAAFRDYGSEYRLRGINSSGKYEDIRKSTNIDIQSGTWNFRIASSEQKVKTWVKYWKESNSEPSNWQLEMDAYLPGRPSFGIIGTCKGEARYNHYYFYELREINFGGEPKAQPISRQNQDPNNAEISLNISDADNDKMNVTFYDASDDTVIGEVKNKQNGTYSVEWTGLSADKTYKWYAKVTDGGNTVETGNESFTTTDVDLSWTDNSENEDGFKIYNNASGNFKQVGKTGENTANFVDFSKNLGFGKYICYQIKSYNKYGESKPAEGCITP